MEDIIRTVVNTSSDIQQTGSTYDIMARLKINTAANVASVTFIDSHKFQSHMMQVASKWKEDVRLLNDVIEWQHKIIDFNSSYTAYLLEQIDEDEFDQVAEAMAVDESDLSPVIIAPAISRLLELTSIDYAPSDLANMFHCSQETISEALALVPHQVIDSHPSLIETAE